MIIKCYSAYLSYSFTRLLFLSNFKDCAFLMFSDWIFWAKRLLIAFPLVLAIYYIIQIHFSDLNSHHKLFYSEAKLFQSLFAKEIFTFKSLTFAFIHEANVVSDYEMLPSIYRECENSSHHYRTAALSKILVIYMYTVQIYFLYRELLMYDEARVTFIAFHAYEINSNYRLALLS